MSDPGGVPSSASPAEPSSTASVGQQPARPPDRRVRRTRQALREALVSLVLERGYEATTVRDIVERADVGRSAFYAHFADKEDLFVSIFQELHGPFGATPGEGAPLFAMSRELFRLADRERRLYRAVFGRFGSVALQARTDQAMFEMVRAEFARVSARPEPAPSAAARMAVSAFLGLLRWWLDGDEDATADQLADSFVAMLQPGSAAILGVSPGRLAGTVGS